MDAAYIYTLGQNEEDGLSKAQFRRLPRTLQPKSFFWFWTQEIDPRSNWDETPLIMAARAQKSLPTCDFLVSEGADMQAPRAGVISVTSIELKQILNSKLKTSGKPKTETLRLAGIGLTILWLESRFANFQAKTNYSKGARNLGLVWEIESKSNLCGNSASRKYGTAQLFYIYLYVFFSFRVSPHLEKPKFRVRSLVFLGQQRSTWMTTSKS